jgi:hypothetical protein
VRVTLAGMSDDVEPTPEQLKHLVEETNTISSALLVAVVRQVAAPVGSPEHAALTADALRLSTQLAAVPLVSPQDAVFVAARTAAAVITSLSAQLGIDPVDLASTVEQNLFFAQNRPTNDPNHSN